MKVKTQIVCDVRTGSSHAYVAGGMESVVELGDVDHEQLPSLIPRLVRIARGSEEWAFTAHYFISYVFQNPFELDGFVNIHEGESYPRLVVEPLFSENYHTPRSFEVLKGNSAFIDRWAQNLRRSGRTENEVKKEQEEFHLGYSKDDFVASLEVWGRTLNSDGDGGEQGVNGYHAGLVHYFEYRAKADKFGRFRGQPCTWGGFIALTWKLSEYMKNEENPDVAKRVLFVDEEGHRQGYILTKNGDLIVAFGYPGQSLKVVSIIVGQSLEKFEKIIAREKDPAIRPVEGRYNQTVGELTEIPWKREAK